MDWLSLSFQAKALRLGCLIGLLIMFPLSSSVLLAQQSPRHVDSKLESYFAFEMEDGRQLPEWLHEVLNVGSYSFLPMGFYNPQIGENTEYVVFANSEQLDCGSTVCDSTLVQLRDGKISNFLSFPLALDEVTSVHLNEHSDVCVSGEKLQYCMTSAPSKE